MKKHWMLKGSIAALLIALSALFISGCGEKTEAPVSPGIDFVMDYESALSTAAAKNQKVLVDFYTDWCYWCKVLDTSTYVDSAVIEFSKTIVFAKINAEIDTSGSAETTALAEEYNIQGYPTLILMEADGTEIERIVGYLPPVEFLETLNDYVKGINTFDDYLGRVKTEQTAEVFYALGVKYKDRGMFDEAASYYKKVFEIDPGNKNGHTHEAMLALGGVYSNQEKYDEAIAHYEGMLKNVKGAEATQEVFVAYGRTYVSTKEYEKAIANFDEAMNLNAGNEVAEDAMLWKAYVYRSKINDTAEALSVYEDFLVKFPESSDISRIKETVEKLTNPAPAEEEAN